MTRASGFLSYELIERRGSNAGRLKGELMKDKMMYDAFVARVCDESDIVATVSEYVTLKKNGRNYWGCCPFHNEKTPSFSVRPDKGFFYCFGCQAGGNVITFMMKIENVPYYEAIKLLAEKHKIPLPQREKTPKELERERAAARLYGVHELAKDFFYACLTKTGYGKAPKAYFLDRGVDDDAIGRFGLGFAPDAWDKFTSAFVKRGFSEELLVKAGLAAPRKSGGAYDRFRGRVMFPIADARGRVIAFGGRVLGDGQPKYLNSPETEIFNKRRVLFGLNLAYKEIKEKGYAIVMEGYMDVVTAHSHGIRNAVASLGTSFTAEQCKMLLRFAPEIRFAYDSDGAGQNATLRALPIARESGAVARVISIPQGKDPDDFIRARGAQAFFDLADHAQSLVDYQIERVFGEHDCASLEGKVGAVAGLVPVLAEINNAVEMNAYIARISQTLGIDEIAVRSELRKFLSFNKKDKNVKVGQNIRISTLVEKADNAADSAARHIIRLLWNDNSIIPYLEAKLTVEEFTDESHREIIEFLLESNANGEPINDIRASERLSESAGAELSRCFVDGPEEEGDSLRLVDDCIKSVHAAYLTKQYEAHRLKADELQRMGDEGYLQELMQSQRIKDEINKMYYE